MSDATPSRVGAKRPLADLARRAAGRTRRLIRALTGHLPPTGPQADPANHRGIGDRGKVFDVGFHGDRYLLALVDRLMPEAANYIETGTNLGSTTRYVAERFAPLAVHACEMDRAAADHARRLIADADHAEVYCQGSPDFIHWLHDHKPDLRRSLNFYFLDAHGHGFEWPLAGELEYLSQFERAILLIDDVQVPGRPEFQYGRYGGTECTLAYIEHSLAPGRTYDVVLPDYAERTSPHHPLEGYAFVAFGTPLLRQAVEADPHFKHQTLTPAARVAA